MADPGVFPPAPPPSGERELAAMQAAGFGPNEQLQQKQRESDAMLHAGFKQDEIDAHWGDHPPRSSTADGAMISSVVHHAWNDFTAPMAGAWEGLQAQQSQNWQHAFHPTVVDQVTSGMPVNGSTVRAAETIWSGLNVVFSPVVGAINTVGAPIGRAMGDAGVPAPHLTVDLKSPSSNILDPTQWTFKAGLVHGAEAGAEYGGIITGLAALAVGGKAAEEPIKETVRAAPSARAAAMEAVRKGEIRDPAQFPQAVVRGEVSPQVQAQFPATGDYQVAAKGMLGQGTVAGPPEAVDRLVKNMHQVWEATGLNPDEQASLAANSPWLRQQLFTQDVNGDPTTVGFHDAAPPSAPSFTDIATHPANEAGRSGEEAKATFGKRGLPTFVNSVDTAMGIMRQLEGSGDQAVSKAGAVGRYQIMPGTARAYGFDPARLKDSAYNETVGRAIISDLYRQFHGNMEAMSIAYNDGPGRARQWLAAGPGMRLEAVRDNSMRSGWRYESVPSARDERFMPMETQQYVARARAKMGAGEEEPAAGTRQFPAWKTDALPGDAAAEAAKASALDKEGAPAEPQEKIGGGSLSAANAWENATPEEVTKEMWANTGEQPTSEVHGNYNGIDRAMADYVSGLHPFDKLSDALGIDKDHLFDIEKDMTIRDAFQQVNGASSRVSSFIRDGIVERLPGLDYRLVPDTPSLMSSMQKAMKAGKKDEWIASMWARRTNNQATKFVDAARERLLKAIEEQTQAGVPAEGADAAAAVKTKADAKVKAAEAAFEKALKKPGIDTGFNPFAAKRVETDPYWKRYDEATHDYQQVKAGVLQYAVDSGRLNEHSMNSMLKTDPIHLSMQRIGIDSKDTGFKKLKGSDRKVVSDPIAADVSNWNWVIRESDRAAATDYLIQRASADPNVMARFGLRKVEDAGPDETEVQHALKQFGFGEEQLDEAHDAFSAVLQDKMDERLKPNQFPRYVDGKREVWQAGDEILAKAIRGAGTKIEAEALVKAANMFADVERTAITIGPDWGWVFGSIHQLSQFINDGLHPIPAVTVLRGWFHQVLGDKIALETRAGGGLNASMADLKGDYLEHLMTDLEETGVTGFGAMKERVKDLWSDESSAPATWNTVMWPAQFSRMMTEMIDAGNRTGLVAQGRAAGLTVGKAGARARRTGLDFQDRGLDQVGRLMTRASPMYQGFLKGTSQWVGALRDRPVSTTAVAGSIGMAVFMNYALNVLQSQGDDIPDAQKWDQVSRYDKDRYLITPMVNGQRIHMRLPPGPLGFLFGGLQQRLLDHLRSGDPHAFDGAVLDFFAENLRLPVPAVVTPPTEAIANHSFFTGHAIIPASLQASAPAEQYTPATTSVSRKIASLLDPLLADVGVGGFSPMQLDHIVQGWSGRYGIGILNELGGRPPHQGQPVTLATVPGLSRFFEQNTGLNANAIGDYYSDKQRFDQALSQRTNARREAKGVALAQQMGGQPGPPDAETYQTAVADAAYAQADHRLNTVSAALGVQRAAIQSILDGKLPDNEKRQHVTAIATQMVHEAEAASQEMRQFEAQQK